MQLRYFDISEFDSPDLKGSGSRMQESTLLMLDDARELAAIPFVVSSGYRTPEHNARVGGVNGSSHTRGYAVDIICRNSLERMAIVQAGLAVGFHRIGISKSFIHLDNDPDKSSHVLWLY